MAFQVVRILLKTASLRRYYPVQVVRVSDYITISAGGLP